MSVWNAVVGALSISVGVLLTWDGSRILASPPYRRRPASPAERRARRKALANLRLSLFLIVIGLAWIAGWNTNWIFAWLAGVYALTNVSYDVYVWRRSRKRRTPGGQPAETP